jgi:hypothetical protein
MHVVTYHTATRNPQLIDGNSLVTSIFGLVGWGANAPLNREEIALHFTTLGR